MDRQTSDQGWQQLQVNIARFLRQSLQSDGRKLEYKPRFIATLSEMSTEYSQIARVLPQCRTSASAIAENKGGTSNAPHKRSMDV